MHHNLYAATRNSHKLKEISRLLKPLGIRVRSCSELADIQVEEEGRTFLANARLKVEAYMAFTHQWVLADDSGLEVEALGGAPGVHSARYATPHDDSANNAKLLKELSSCDSSRRNARFVCAVALACNGEVVFTTEGKVEGRILTEPRGKQGFGYDPLFYYPDYGKTFAQMPPELKNRVSHRGRALRAVAAFLSRRLPRISDST